MSLRIVFFGTSAFAARIYSFLIQHSFNIVAVVTRIDKPKGRSLQFSPPPVKEKAIEITPQMPIHQPLKASTPEFAEILKNYHPDLFIVVAYGEIIKQNILDIPSWGCVNIHASLLPKYRGAAPMQRCLMQGEKETGITLIKMELEMDAGDILEVVKIPVSAQMTWGEMDEELSKVAQPALTNVIQKIEKGTIQRTLQQHALCTFAPKIIASEEEIHWNKSAYEIHNLIRALSPLPGAWCFVEIKGEKKRLKIKRSEVIYNLKGRSGQILSFSPEEWIVACGEDALKLLEVQLEGKKTMEAATFLRGLNGSLKFE